MFFSSAVIFFSNWQLSKETSQNTAKHEGDSLRDKDARQVFNHIRQTECQTSLGKLAKCPV